MKKFIALLLSLTLIFSAFSALEAFALEDTPEVDKTVLIDVLTEGMPVGGRYTPESLEAFETARVQAQAVYDDPNATQEQVDKAVEDLQNAINNIEPAKVDVTKLEELLDSASIYIDNKDNYTTISYKAFKDAFSQAQCQYYLGNVQSEIDSAYDDLDAAIKNLVLITDTAGVFKGYVDSRNPITKNRTYVYTELTDIGDYKVVYGGYSEKRTNNYSKYVGGYCFKLNYVVSPESLAVYLVKNDEVITLEDAFRDGLVPDMKVVVDAFNRCEYKDDIEITFIREEKSLKQKIDEKFGDTEVKDYKYLFSYNEGLDYRFMVAYASADTENKECTDNLGDYELTSTVTSSPYDMGIYCVTNEGAYTLKEAYENNLFSDVYLFLRELAKADNRYSYVNTNPDVESEFYEYAGLSKSEAFFEVLGETEDYTVCRGGSLFGTCLYYSHIIGEYEFPCPSQPSPYDIALFIYKDGAFKKLHESYLDGDIDIDEVVGLITDGTYSSNYVKPLIKTEIGKFGDYTLYYKGLQGYCYYNETVNIGKYEICVKRQFCESDLGGKNYGSTVLGLYLENGQDTVSLVDAYNNAVISDDDLDKIVKLLKANEACNNNYYVISEITETTAKAFKEYIDAQNPFTTQRTFAYAELTDIGDYKVVYGGYRKGRSTPYTQEMCGYSFKMNYAVSPNDVAIYLVKDDEVICLKDAYRDGLIPDMEVIVDAFNECKYKDDMKITFVENEKPLKQMIDEYFGDTEVKEYKYLFRYEYFSLVYASADTENKECSDSFGDYKLTSTVTSSPYDMGIYCVSSEKVRTLKEAYDNNLLPDIYLLLKKLAETDSRYSYVNTNPTLKSEFLEYAELSETEAFFGVIKETEDYTICCGGSLIVTNLYYSHVIGEYEFISASQPSPYDLALFIYKDGAFKKLHRSYLDGDIDIDEVVGYITNGTYTSSSIKPLTKIEIGKIGDYTLYYKGLQVNGNAVQNVKLGGYDVCVKNIIKNGMFSWNYGSTVLGLYLEDKNGNIIDLQSAYDTGLITDPQAVAYMLYGIENSSDYFNITPTPTDPADNGDIDIIEEPQPIKKANTVKVKSNTVTVKAKNLKTKKITKEALKITKAKGKVDVTISRITLKGKKVSKKIAKKFNISSKGKLTMGKALTKGNYKITAKVVAKGSVHYKAKTLTETFTVKIK
ncbi:MAG: FIVAR domain-containing protein [Ruminococcus sp.]